MIVMPPASYPNRRLPVWGLPSFARSASVSFSRREVSSDDRQAWATSMRRMKRSSGSERFRRFASPWSQDLVLVGDREQLFEVPGLTHQPVGVVDDDVAELPLARAGEQFVPSGALPVAAPGRPAVVDEDVPRVDHEAPALGDLAADPLLTVHARLVVIVRVGDPTVDGCRLSRRDHRLLLPVASHGPIV